MTPDNNWPTGAVTFLFSDIEDSTPLWERHRAAMRQALAEHDALLQTAVETNGGVLVKTTGDGAMAVFSSPLQALTAAIEAQRLLHEAPWLSIAPDRIGARMGLNSGEAELRAGDYYGTAVNRAARIMDAGHGGQVLLSDTTARLLEGSLTQKLILSDLGKFQLKGLSQPARIFQAHSPGLPQEFPPLRAAGLATGNLPGRLTSFVGRERELANVESQLKETRLLTLTGPGGTGKTRLSLEAAFLVQSRYEHGAWIVELAPITDPQLVVSAVASIFGLQSQAGSQIGEILHDFLREKELLLILDNCEHLVAACAELAANLIVVCPRLTILASSREGLGVYGETTYHLPTLSLPEGSLHGGNGLSAAAAAQSEAVQLFVERAAAAQPGFRLSDANAAAVAQIVRRLDGIPLAIELAAARLKAFSVEQVAARLDDRFRLLTGGSRTALPRQQTLRALIDWSYDLLDEEERDLFRRLSVFMGGWTFEAAEAMAESPNLRGFNQAADAVQVDLQNLAGLDVYELLPQLVSKSLVTRESEPQPGYWPDGAAAPEPRYYFLETIRQYARDRLVEAGEVEEARDRHFAYYEALAESAGLGAGAGTTLLQGPQASLEHDNLRTAIEWGIARYPDRVLNMIWNLSFFISNQLPGPEFINWTAIALRKLEALPPAAGEAAEQRELARHRGLVALSLLNLFLGQLDEADRVAAVVSETLRQTDDDPYLLAMALFVRAQTAYFFEDRALGELIDEGLALLQQLEDQPAQQSMLVMALMLSAGWAARVGDDDLARRRFNEITVLLGSPQNQQLPWLQFSLLSMMMQMGLEEKEALREQYEKAVWELRQAGSRRIAAMAESDWAHRLRHDGDPGEALAIYRRMLVEWRDLGHRAAMANILENIAFVERAQERPQRAATFFGAAERIREDIGQDMLRPERQEYEREIAALKGMLDSGELERLWAQGRALSTDALIDLALEENG